MDRGSDKHGSRIDEELESQTEPLERSGRESHVEGEREQESPDEEVPGSGHRIAGTGSSADEYPLKDRGESGGASHPQPKDDS
jgi:hypothetical protein